MVEGEGGEGRRVGRGGERKREGREREGLMERKWRERGSEGLMEREGGGEGEVEKGDGEEDKRTGRRYIHVEGEVRERTRGSWKRGKEEAQRGKYMYELLPYTHYINMHKNNRAYRIHF